MTPPSTVTAYLGWLHIGWLTAVMVACGEAPEQQALAPSTKPTLHFVDVASDVGLDAFQQVSGEADKLYLPAATGAGVALFDADADGDLDVFLINGSRIGGFEAGQEPTNRLFLNDNRGQTFRDVTATSGLDSSGAWGQGLAVADIDGDQDLDLYVTNYGANALYFNQGDGTFVEGAADAGIDSSGWSTGAAFIDYDRDGDLDLYVANFVRYDQVLAAYEGRDWLTHTWKGLQVASGPMGLPAAQDQLFRNDSTEHRIRFTDVTTELGIATVEPSYGFQPTLADFDGDRFVDLFVANDSRPNFLWRNVAGSSFRESALATGAAYDRAGGNQACMGVALEDHDGDGDFDVFVTNFADELNTLYVADSSGFFHDDTLAAGLIGESTKRNLAWGTFFFDSDNDGDLDLFVANGHIYPQVDGLARSGLTDVAGTQSYAQANELFLQVEPGRYRDHSTAAGPGLAVRKVSRGAAMGDLDDDGDLDIVINNLDDSPTVLRNNSQSQGHWLKVLVRGSGRNLTAIGAQVRVEAAGRQYRRTVRSSDSFLSHHDLRLHFGLGAADAIDRILVDWPDGSTEAVTVDKINTLVVIEQGPATHDGMGGS